LCQPKVGVFRLEVDVVKPDIRISNTLAKSLCKKMLIRIPVSGLSLTILGDIEIEFKNDAMFFYYSNTICSNDEL
jgi:hypothetical protein